MTTPDTPAILRFVLGQAMPTERTEIAEWLAAHPSEQARLEELRRALEATQGPAVAPDVDAEWSAMAARIASEVPDTASLAVVHDPRARRPSSPIRIGRTIARSPRERWAWAGLSAAAAAIIVALGVIVPRSHLMNERGGAPREYTTAAAERAAITLSDGTRLVLAPGSRLAVDGAYGEKRRDLTLDGEAYFEVVHDGGRPFTVRTRVGVTEDLGTRFDVRSYGDERETRVVVAQGRVAVRGMATPAVALGVGDMGRVAPTGPVIVARVDPASAVAWTEGRLVFEHTPVREVLATLGRWYDLDVTATDSGILDGHVTAAFTTESVDDVLAAIATALDARVERHGRTVTLTESAHATR